MRCFSCQGKPKLTYRLQKKGTKLAGKKGKQTEYTEQSNLIAKIAMKTVLTSTTAVTPEFLTQNRSAATPLTKA